MSPCNCSTQDSRGCEVDQAAAQVLDAKDFIDLLVVRYPRLFRDQSPRFPSFVPGPWQSIVLRLFDDIDRLLDDEAAAGFFVSQVRSKYGGLRVYCWLASPNAARSASWQAEHHCAAIAIRQLIEQAERETMQSSACDLNDRQTDIGLSRYRTTPARREGDRRAAVG